MRESMIARNSEFRNDLSRDLGAIAGLLFDIGSRKLRPDESLPLAPAELERMEATVARRDPGEDRQATCGGLKVPVTGFRPKAGP